MFLNWTSNIRKTLFICHHGSKGPTIWLLRVGMGDFRKKKQKQKQEQSNLRGKIFLRKYLRKKILHWKKYLSWRLMWKKSYTFACHGKKNLILSPEVWQEKNSYPNQITHTPPPPLLQKSNGRSLLTLTRPVIYQNSCCISLRYIVTCWSYFSRFLDVKDLPFK